MGTADFGVKEVSMLTRNFEYNIGGIVSGVMWLADWLIGWLTVKFTWRVDVGQCYSKRYYWGLVLESKVDTIG